MFLKFTLVPYMAARCLHSSCTLKKLSKVPLSKLRKKTGFSFIKCKEALEKFNNDMKQAEAWLREQAQKEGWAKAGKLQGRPMSQGLIAIARKSDTAAAIIEVNCETDFVARNPKFQDFVDVVGGTVLHEGIASTESKVTWKTEKLSELCGSNSKSLADLMALQIGALGENMVIQRGAFIKSSQDERIGHYIHAAGPPVSNSTSICSMGKYGALVSFSQSEAPTQNPTVKKEDIGRMLAQHIVGMNPKTIGNIEEFKQNVHQTTHDRQEATKDKSANPGEEVKQEVVVGDECTNPGQELKREEEDESRMIFQEFLFDPDKKVGEFLLELNLKVKDFVRYECGEELDEEE